MPTTRRSNITDNNSEMERTEDVHIVEPDERVSNNEKKQLNIKKYISSNMLFEVWNLTKIYLFWICIHMLSVNLYCYFCAYPSLYGLFISPFLAVAPHCKALSWMMTNSITSISNMWLTLGTWCTTKLIFNNN